MNYYDLIPLILTQLHKRINSDEFLERFRRPNSFVRYRKLTLKQVVAYLIHSKKRSMDIELSDLQRQLPDIDFPDVSRQAVSKARKGILPDLFKELLDKQVEMVYTHLDCPKNWFLDTVFLLLMGLHWRFPCPMIPLRNLGLLPAATIMMFSGLKVCSQLFMMFFSTR